MVALAAAVAIGFILWLQVDEYGLGDTPWLMGVLAIAALLLVSLRTQKARAPGKDVPNPARETPRGITAVQAFTSARNQLERFYSDQAVSAARAKASKIGLHKPFLIRTGAFMVALLVMEKKIKGFGSARGADELRKIAIDGLLEVARFEEARFKGAMPSNLIIEGLPDETVLLAEAKTQISRCEQAVRDCIPLFATSERYPIDPILALLDEPVSLAGKTSDRRDQAYGPTFRAMFRVLDSREAIGVDTRSSETLEKRENPKPLDAYPIRNAVEGLIDQMRESARSGVRPETMLIPHIRIKLDIITAAYQRDMKRAISGLYDRQLARDEVEKRAAEIRTEVEQMCYALRREPSHSIEQLFDRMSSQRSDIGELEQEVRAATSAYDNIPPVGG